MSHDPSAPQPWQPPPGVQSWQPPPGPQQAPPGPPAPWQPPPDWPPPPPPKRRSWPVVVAGIVGSVVGLVSLGGAVLFMFGGGLGQRVEFGGGQEVYYKNVPREEAERLGKVLQDLRLFNNQGPKTVQLLKRDGQTVVNIVVLPGIWDQQDQLDAWLRDGRLLAARAYPDTPLEVGLCDEHMRVRRTIAVEPTGRITCGPGEEVLFPSSLRKEAERLGKVLQEVQYFNNQGPKTVQLLKRDDQTLVIFAVRDGVWEQPQHINGFTFTGLLLAARALPGIPLEIGLCDIHMKVRRTIAVEATDRLTFGPKEEVFFTSPLKKEAEQLGKVLQQARIFDGGNNSKSVLLRRRGDTWRVHFATLEGVRDNPQAVAFFRQLGAQLRQQVFAGGPVEVCLCDPEFTPRKTLTVP
jgi:hypothetical protein